jgi:hypothetical protein
MAFAPVGASRLKIGCTDMAKKIKRTKSVADTLVCSDLQNWPEEVFPHDSDSARHLVQSNRDKLFDAGALVRYNRTLVVIGVPYINWLRTLTAGVKDIEMPCNAPAVKARRNGKEAHP